MIDDKFFNELLAWLPWIYGFMAWSVLVRIITDVILPKFPKLDKFLDKIIEKL